MFKLLPNVAPLTVQNFLNYVNKGAYNNSFFHRSVANFVVQGGGFQWVNGAAQAIPSDKPVKNEYSASNIRGTLAMAKVGGDPDSATNQWFFNTINNASNLNNNNGGFTVFGGESRRRPGCRFSIRLREHGWWMPASSLVVRSTACRSSITQARPGNRKQSGHR